MFLVLCGWISIPTNRIVHFADGLPTALTYEQCNIVFVCLVGFWWCLPSLLNIRGHIAMVPVCSSGILTNVLQHRNAMLQTQDLTPHPVTVYRQRADLSLCYPLMWSVAVKYATTQFNLLGQTRPGNPSSIFHIHQRTLNLWCCYVGNQSEARYFDHRRPKVELTWSNQDNGEGFFTVSWNTH